MRYTRIMSALPLESSRIVGLNIVLLFCVSIEPFLYNIVRNPPPGVVDAAGFGNTASTLFALDMGTMMLILGGFTLILASEERRLVPRDMTSRFRREGLSWLATGAVFFFSALPVFFTINAAGGVPLRYYLWAFILLFVYVYRTVEARLARRSAQGA